MRARSSARGIREEILGMKKGKAITLLSIVCVLLAALLVCTFARFTVGVKDYNSFVGAIELDYDMEGGVAYTLELDEDNDEEITDIDQVIDTLESRLDSLGYTVYSVTAIKPIVNGVEESDLDYKIRIAVKNTESISTDIQTVTAYGTVSFLGGETQNPTTEIFKDIDAIESASYQGSGFNAEGQEVYQVGLTLTEKAYDELMSSIETATTNSASYYLGIKLGDQVVMDGSTAISKDAFSERTVYITNQTEAGAKQLALQLSTGGLAYKFNGADKPLKITAPIGETGAMMAGITVFALATCLAILFFVKFKGYGVVATLSLLTFILVETAMMIAVPGINFSIGGIIGGILATMLCADGLTMIIKRISEEGSNGKTVKSAVKTGYNRALFPVLNTNVISGVVALLLFAFTQGVVRTFAIAFGIGAVLSFLVTILISRMFTELILPLSKNKEKFLNIKREDA